MAAKRAMTGSTITTTQLKEFFTQIDAGEIRKRELQAILERRNPWEPAIVIQVYLNSRNRSAIAATVSRNKLQVSDAAREVINSLTFVATNRSHKLCVIRGDELEPDELDSLHIRALAADRGYQTPAAEVAPVLFDLADRGEIDWADLGALVVMHDPIPDSDQNPSVLGIYRHDGDCRLHACSGDPSARWRQKDGFVFEIRAA